MKLSEYPFSKHAIVRNISKEASCHKGVFSHWCFYKVRLNYINVILVTTYFHDKWMSRDQNLETRGRVFSPQHEQTDLYSL